MNKLTGPSIRFPVQPRDVPAIKAARRLHLTLPEFEQVSPQLRRRGFPQPDPTTGHYDLRAIDAWMDQRSSLAPTEAQDPALNWEERLAALRASTRRRGRPPKSI